ncbi:hypothetical protein KZ327_00605, partial [Glaesserella parasuis]|nr:hypothetical protein [Glaesserella parasuis]
GVISTPPSLEAVVGQVDVAGALDTALLGIIFSFMLVNLFDSSGNPRRCAPFIWICSEARAYAIS